MKPNQFSVCRATAVFASAIAVLAVARAANADAFPTYDANYIKLSAGGSSVSGSSAALQARTQHAKSGTAGIEDFNYTYDLSKETNLQVDGKAMPGNEDYLLKFLVTKNELGSFEAGYKRFRTFYDGAGGFFPSNNQFLPIFQRSLFVDRGSFFVNATLAMPKAPVFTFKYSNDTRTGTKDTTIWGDSDLTGIPILVGTGAVNPVSANRKMLPAFIKLNERQERWEATMRHTVANTTAVVSLGGDRINNHDLRSIDRYVGEFKLFPYYVFSSPTAVANNSTQNPNHGEDIQGVKEHGYTLGARIETVVNDKVTVFAGVNYHNLKQTTEASRLIYYITNTGAGIKSLVGGFAVAEPTASPRIASATRPPYSYTASGDIKQDILSANIGVQTKPLPSLGIDFALKAETDKNSGLVVANYYNTGVQQTTGVVTALPPYVAPQSFDNSEKPWTPAIDVRYTGIRTMALYGSWEYRSVTQDEKTSYNMFGVSTSGTTPAAVITTPAGPTLTNDHVKEKHSNISVGTNWTPAGPFSLRAEVFSKDHENRFEGYGPSAGAFYILDYDIYGTKLTGTIKPHPAVGFTVRYVAQRGKASSVEDGYAKGDTNDARRQSLSGTIDFNPSKNVYAQVNGSVVYDNVITSYPYITGTAKDVLRNAENNYSNGDVTIGCALDASTDVQLLGTYYRANNYDGAQAFATIPYGASAQEYTAAVGFKYKLDVKTVVSGKVGYMDRQDDTSGGYKNFRGPMAYVSVQRAF